MFKRLLVVSTVIACILGIDKNLGIAHSPDQIDTRHSESMTHSDTEHHHKTMEIPASQPIPSVNLIVHKDPVRGYNLEVQVSNFRFAPAAANQAAKPGEGHGHLYINGKKITRLYGSWYYLENLQPGKNEITVSLNSNNHATLAHNGKVIQDSVIVEVPASSHSKDLNPFSNAESRGVSAEVRGE